MTPEQGHASEGAGSSAPAKPPVGTGGVRAGKRSLIVALLALAATVVLVAYVAQQALRPAAPRESVVGSRAGSGPGFSFVTLPSPRPVPQLKFTDKDGRALSLGDFRGKMVLLNIWATWCPPCRKEMPSLDRLQARLGSPGFEVVAASIDQGNDALFIVEEFFREIGIKHLRIYLDSTGGAARTVGALGLPVTLLVDRRGMEIGRLVGPAEWDSPEAIAMIRQHLGPSPGSQ